MNVEGAGPLRIRRAEIGDYKAVQALEELEFQAHRQARPDYFKTCSDYARSEFAELLDLPCPICWLAEWDGRVVGLCFGKIGATPENQVCRSRRVALIEDLVTLPEYRGRGVAAALMARARAQAVDEGAVSLELCAWSFNEGALRLYKRLGLRVQYSRMEERLESGGS